MSTGRVGKESKYGVLLRVRKNTGSVMFAGAGGKETDVSLDDLKAAPEFTRREDAPRRD